jgi:hypothetical protein
MNINFISKINTNENKSIIWFFLIVGFILSIYYFVYYEVIQPYFVWDFQPAFADLIYFLSSSETFFELFFVLWMFLPYVIFSTVALKMKKEKVLLTSIGLIMVLVHIYLYYISYISTSVGSSITLFFIPVILIAFMFAIIGIKKLYLEFKK